jgi:hypothetical protein
MPWPHALRDLAIVMATLGIWTLERSLTGSGGALQLAVGVLAGLLTAVCGYLLHEWGHLAGARLSGSAVELPSSPAALFLFRFDVEHNVARHFVAMSCGGFLASAAVVTALITTLPSGSIGSWVALGLTGLGVVATLVSELPPFFRVLGDGAMPRGSAYVSSEEPAGSSARRAATIQSGSAPSGERSIHSAGSKPPARAW